MNFGNDLNDTKAGMKNLDKEKINKIIAEATKDSNFTKKQEEREKSVSEAVKRLQDKISKLTPQDLDGYDKKAAKLILELEKERDFSKTIVHVDMDAYFAAVEMRDNPQLRDVPMAVGSNSMLSTSNYLARKYGVRAAMPGYIAKKLCPHLKIVPGSYRKYAEVAQDIQSVLKEFHENFEPVGLDESYLDISHLCNAANSAESIVSQMRKAITEKTQLTCSAGIASNKFLAKVCSDINKPNGQFFLEKNSESVKEFLKKLPVRKINGIGSVTAKLLNGVGIITADEILQ